MANGHSTVALCIIGTEITRGIIADKHATIMARELTNLGYLVSRIVIVPDDGSLSPLLRQCAQEVDIILLTGGLGPTSDDLTRQVVADLAGVPLVLDDDAYQDLYARIGDRIEGANKRQVLFPKGFRVIPNPKGTAPGFTGSFPSPGATDDRLVTCYAMPGPPAEMHEMFFGRVLPELAEDLGKTLVGRDEYTCFLTPESKLEDICYEHASDSILWGTRAQEYRISLYLNGGSLESREAMGKAIQQHVGKGLVQRGDVSVVDLLSDYLRNNGMTLACAESCTGGLVGKLMTDRPGSSQWFWGSVVSYANSAKEQLLGISTEEIAEYGAVSKQVVSSMAQSVLHLSGADLAIAVSGIAGPDGGTSDKPVGTVWFGFAGSSLPPISLKLQLSTYGRSSVRRRAAVAALLLAYFYVKGDDLLDIIESWQYI